MDVHSTPSLLAQTVPQCAFLPEGILFNFALRIDHHGGAFLQRVGRPRGSPLGARVTGPSERGPHFAHVQRGFFAIRVRADKRRARGILRPLYIDVVKLVPNLSSVSSAT